MSLRHQSLADSESAKDSIARQALSPRNTSAVSPRVLQSGRRTGAGIMPHRAAEKLTCMTVCIDAGSIKSYGDGDSRFSITGLVTFAKNAAGRSGGKTEGFSSFQCFCPNRHMNPHCLKINRNLMLRVSRRRSGSVASVSLHLDVESNLSAYGRDHADHRRRRFLKIPTQHFRWKLLSLQHREYLVHAHDSHVRNASCAKPSQNTARR